MARTAIPAAGNCRRREDRIGRSIPKRKGCGLSESICEVIMVFRFHFSRSLLGYDTEEVLTYFYRYQSGKDAELNALQSHIARLKHENGFLEKRYWQLKEEMRRDPLSVSASGIPGRLGRSGAEDSAEEIPDEERENSEIDCDMQESVRSMKMRTDQLNALLGRLLPGGGLHGGTAEPSPEKRSAAAQDSDENDGGVRARAEDSAKQPEPPKEKVEAPEAGGSVKDKYLMNKITGTDLTDENGSVIIPRNTVIDPEVIAKADAAGKLAELIVNMTIPNHSA